MNSLWRARKGTTLVEILVVMVILLVGIMTVVTMFPTGFRVVRAAESQTIATKLAQAEVERWKNMPENLPDDILPLDVNGQIINDEDPGPSFEGMKDVGLAPGRYYPGNSGDFRKVINETTSIPIGSFFQTGAGPIWGSRYNLAFSPVELTSDGNGGYNGITVKSGDLQRRVGDSDSSMYVRIGQYGIDYNIDSNNTFGVCLSYDHHPEHIYYVSYSYSVSNPQTGDVKYLSTVDQQVNPANPNGSGYNWGWVRVQVNVPSGYVIDGDTIDEGTDSCARGFVQVTAWNAPPQDPNDPYEYAIADSILGIIAFNPKAHNALERTVRGVRALTARVTYTIYDTRIIREERVIPDANEDLDGDHTNDHVMVKLALKFILDSGAPADDSQPNSLTDGDPTDNLGEPTFEGLVYDCLGRQVTNASQVIVPQAMLVIDLATGLRVQWPGDSIAGMDAKHYPIDFMAGIVHLPVKADLIDWGSQSVYKDVPLKGRHLRFFYRADGDWSVQCQKAHTYYLREYSKDLDYQRFRLFQDKNDGLWKLLFVRCMSGQSVAVDYTYTDATGVHKVTGKNLRISDDVITNPVDVNTGALNVPPCCYVTLGPTGTTIDPTDRIIVVGTSFRSRVIWRDGKAWRYVDIGTNLTRNSAP